VGGVVFSPGGISIPTWQKKKTGPPVQRKEDQWTLERDSSQTLTFSRRMFTPLPFGETFDGWRSKKKKQCIFDDCVKGGDVGGPLISRRRRKGAHPNIQPQEGT